MAAKTFWKIIGFRQKEDNHESCEKDNTPVETVVVENEGHVKVFREDTDSIESHDSLPSLNPMPKRPLLRKKSQSDQCLLTYELEGEEVRRKVLKKKQSFRFPAPLCAAESAETMRSVETSPTHRLGEGISIVSLDPHRSKLLKQANSIDRLQSTHKIIGDERIRNDLKQQLRATQSCDLMRTEKHETVRKTMSATSSARIKEESNILRNIKKREMVSAVKGKMDGKGIAQTLKKDMKGKPNIPICSIGFPTQSRMSSKEPNWHDSVFIGECLDWHNLLRARHGVKQLQLDPQLCLMAQNWANLLAHTNEFYYQNLTEVTNYRVMFIYKAD